MARTTCKYPGCDYEDMHRPYSYVRGHRWLPSASMISGVLDNGKSDAMPWASSMIAATTAVHEPERWAHMSTADCTHVKEQLCDACSFLRFEFHVQWQAKANLGTHVHHLALQWADGEDVEVDELCEPYLDAIEAFYADHQPVWIEKERTVLYDKPWTHGYRGQFDGICEIVCPVCGDGERCKWLIDWKSGNYYPTEQTLQLAGYRYAQHLTVWDDGVETITGKMPTVNHAAVVLLDPSGRYRLVELPANGDAHGTFLRLRDALTWTRGMDKWSKDHPIPKLTTQEETTAA